MRVVIDITKMVYKSIKDNHDGWNNYICTAIRNGTVLPDNPTNGDVIKMMFPTVDISTNGKFGKEGTVFVYHKDHIIIFDLDWWNAPYREEKE